MGRMVVICGAALLVACGTPTEPPASSDPSVAGAPAVPGAPGIAAEIVRLRTDDAVGGQVHVRITDTGDDPFAVTAVALDSAGFTPLPATTASADFVPGRVIDLPAPYGSPVCDVQPLPVAVRLTLVRPGGAVEEVLVPSSAEVMGRIHEEECAALRVAAVVDVAVDGLREDGDSVTGTITLTRRSGAEPVTAVRLARSVLLDAVADDLPARLAGEGTVASTPVSFAPATCDPHVLAETKQPYVFVLHVAVGDAEAVPLDLPLDRAQRDLLAELVQRECSEPR